MSADRESRIAAWGLGLVRSNLHVNPFREPRSAIRDPRSLLLPPVILFPLVTYPFSKSIWLANDLVHRPAQPEDFD